MANQKFKYVLRNGIPMPYAPITLSNKNLLLERLALVDTGSASNVLPYSMGIALGLVWDNTKATIPLGGNVNSLAMPVEVTVTIGLFDPVELLFAWADNDIPPLILGQIDFFTEYYVCFFQNLGYFVITSK